MTTKPNLPEQFTLAFSFQGDPVMTAEVNRIKCNRCVLDTGAPETFLVMCDPKINLDLIRLNSHRALINSLIINDVEFGPLEVFVKRSKVDRPGEFAIYLGANQLQGHCLTMDYEKCEAIFNTQIINDNNSNVSKIEIYEGRPIVVLSRANKNYKFILDTGSNGNWLYHNAQDSDLLETGEIISDIRDIPTGFGVVKLTQKISFPIFNIGGTEKQNVEFLMTNKGDFGGLHTGIDGIVGTGYFEGIHKIDFITNQYQIIK